MLKWLKGWMDSNDTTKDVKLLAFSVVVVFAVAKLALNDITDDWVDAFYGLVALVGLGGSAWTFVDGYIRKRRSGGVGAEGDKTEENCEEGEKK